MYTNRFHGLCEQILLIQIALWLTPPVSGLALDSPCTDTSQCDAGLQCDDRGIPNDKKCRIPAGSTEPCSGTTACVTDAVCESQRCKIDLGKSCSGPPPDDHCKANTKCVQISVGSTAYQCRRIYGEQCSQSPECQTVLNEECVGTNPKRCLCKQDYFRLTTCRSKNILTTTPSRSGQAQEKSINVQWTMPTGLNGASLEYKATRNDSSGTDVSSTWRADLSYNFENLIQGTAYSISVTTKTPSNPNYGSNTVEYEGPAVTIYTKPAQPGNLIPEQHRAPDVTLRFNASVGHVESYRVTLTQGGKVTETTLTEATFRGLTAGETYQVTIVAVSGGIVSESQTDSFFVDAEPAGEVSQLNTPQIGSRWVKVTWRIPDDPKGNITGYTVRALDGQLCVSAVMVLCSDCGVSNQSVENCPMWKNVTRTKDQLDQRIDVNVTSLMPDVAYTIRVNAFNQKGKGANTDKNDVRTQSEAAQPLRGLDSTTPAPYQLNVTWTPGERTGPTNYNVSWSERESLKSDNFIPNGSVIVTDYSNTSYIIQNLLSYWEYQVIVFPYTTTVDPPASPTTKTVRTLPTEPGAVTELNITQQDGIFLTLHVKCPREKERNARITSISYSSTIVKAGTTDKDPPTNDIIISNSDQDCDKPIISTITSVAAEATYNFSVFAKADGDLTGIRSYMVVTVEPVAPKLTPPTGGQLVEQKGITQREVALEVCPCLVSKEQGTITLAGIIVCVTTTREDCEAGVGDASMYKYRQKLPTWKEFKDKGYTGKYRATPDNWHTIIGEGVANTRRRRSLLKRVARAADDFVKYTIGDNDTCEQAPEYEYCNGPLPADREINILVFACTSGGCRELPAITNLKTQALDEGVDTAAIVGGIVAALAVIALVVVAVFMYRRYRPQDGDGGHSRLEPHAPRVLRTSRRTVNLEDTLHSRKSVSMILFPARVEVLHRNSNQYFLQEFQELLNKEKTFGYTSDVGKLDVNLVKNRYQHLLPYDHTRVKLYSRGDLGQDYINASYIKGEQSPCDYLATQGPMVSTIPDFWKMVWEQRSPVIVMLSDLTENGQKKIDEYWPGALNSEVQYGNVGVTLVSVSTLPHYTVRKIKLVDKQQERMVTHYHLSGWTDQGASLSLDDIADIVYIVTEEISSCTGPVTVHCSEGTMRTCSFIALHSLQRHVTQHAVGEEIDVFTVLLNIVKCRPHMMQSERQYMLIHDVVRVMVERKMRDDQGRRAVYQNAGCRDNALYDSTYAYIPDGHVYDEIGARKKHQTSEL